MLRIAQYPGHVSRRNDFRSQGRGNHAPNSYRTDFRAAQCSRQIFNSGVAAQTCSDRRIRSKETPSPIQDTQSEQGALGAEGATAVALAALAIKTKRHVEQQQRKDRVSPASRRQQFLATHRSSHNPHAAPPKKIPVASGASVGATNVAQQ
jgi:hypothetical protein